MNIAYVRVSTNKQELDSQKLEIMEYCLKNNIILDEILEIKISSTKSQEKRKIKDLKQKLKSGDLLIATELSRLGRSMLEVINLVLELNDNNINFLFLRQIELSNFNNPSSKLILSIYAYLAENERDLISKRTKAGLENARASGKQLGRPKGTLKSIYDKDIDKIKILIEKDLPIKSIWKLLYDDSSKTYEGFLWFCKNRNLKQS
ncbi:recombinase family protein [Campylobacter insulaenigrae]|uniref:recombinase family protein n=1 Tax=Campylobacter insulaenigrae TaxID=260714 RepID=UPI0021539E64|nr:recombinase family protein [Campylobacter insulaenigrae]MCR6580372.1 recombinase family protein [Campylobacter insulaenigrae]